MNESQIFLDALKLADPAERTAFLDSTCAGNPALRAGVEALLRARAEDPDFLEQPAASLVATMDAPAGPGALTDTVERAHAGTVIGPYKLLEPIGEGGMGTVWMAQQTEPVKRLVAVKLIKAGMDSKQVIARFEAERQALALMDHPNIARVLDGGTTDAGRPYFVMDLVKGVPITKYCDEHHLAPGQRLELFVPVCQAVQHAHQKGLIHRDLKPNNVLVALYDGKPVPKIIDFGVAKAAGPQLTEKTLVTGFGSIIGTLEYMSPEQAEINQLDIDTRSDIYSLGVLLYELLTGSTPLTQKRMKEAVYAEILRMIKEEEPPKPSTRLSDSGEALASISAQRHMEPAKLTKLVRGELDWIVMKALEKDRNRRYETANGFAMDVQRYLADEPVQACPPSAGYRFRKFARRNKRSLVTAALLGVMFVVALGAVTGSIGWIMRNRAAQAAQFEHDLDLIVRDASPLGDKVVDLVTKPTDWKTELTARLSAVERAEALLAANTELATPDLRNRVREIRAQLDGEEKDRRLVARLEDLGLSQGGHVLPETTNYSRAFQEYGIAISMDPEQAGDLIRKRPAPVHDLVLGGLDGWQARALWTANRHEVAWLRAVIQVVDKDPWRNEVRLAAVKDDWRKLEELSKSADLSKHPAQSLVLLGRALANQKSFQSALKLVRRAQLYTPGDFWVNWQVAYYSTLMTPPQYNQAVRYFSVAAVLRPHNPFVLWWLSVALHNTGDHDGAIAALHKALEAIYQQALQGQPNDPYFHDSLVDVARQADDLEGAIALYQKLIAMDPRSVHYFGLGRALQDHGDLAGAHSAYREAVAMRPTSPTTLHWVGNNSEDLGDMPTAIAGYLGAVEIAPDFISRANLHQRAGLCLKRQGKLAEALAALQKAHDLAAAEPHPLLSESWALKQVRDCERLIELESKLPAILRGELQPASSAERIDLARLCAFQKLYGISARLYEEAFQAEPQLAGSPLAGQRWSYWEAHRYHAAVTAALAGAGQGQEKPSLNEPTRAHWRRQAVVWLRSDLGVLVQKLGKGDDLMFARQTLDYWQYDKSLEGIRDPQKIAKLPAEEANDCRTLWSDVQKAQQALRQTTTVGAKKSAP